MSKTGAFVSVWIGAAVIPAVIACSTGYADGGPAREYYESGQLKSEKFVENGKEEGPFKNYSESGELASEGTYTDGKLDGPYKSYFVGGLLKSEITYKDGKTETVKNYDENGQLIDTVKHADKPAANDPSNKQGQKKKKAPKEPHAKGSQNQAVKEKTHRMPRWTVG
ncbi:MAG: hypothetical protein ABH891_10285 [Candidatus Omnitrophota bacterium]